MGVVRVLSARLYIIILRWITQMERNDEDGFVKREMKPKKRVENSESYLGLGTARWMY